MREDLTDNLLDALESFGLDVLLIALPEQGGAYRSMPLFREPFCFACPTEHALANRPVVTERELAHERLLLLDEGHCLRDQALAVCGNRPGNHADASDDFRATSLETISEMVAAGLGSTLLPAMAVPHLTARHLRLEVRPLQAAKAYRRIGLLWRASFPRGEDLEVLGDLSRSSCQIRLSRSARPRPLLVTSQCRLRPKLRAIEVILCQPAACIPFTYVAQPHGAGGR